jgi:hypothetical protein
MCVGKRQVWETRKWCPVTTTVCDKMDAIKTAKTLDRAKGAMLVDDKML